MKKHNLKLFGIRYFYLDGKAISASFLYKLWISDPRIVDKLFAAGFLIGYLYDYE